jgi:hypothetical protein
LRTTHTVKQYPFAIIQQRNPVTRASYGNTARIEPEYKITIERTASIIFSAGQRAAVDIGPFQVIFFYCPAGAP